VCVARGSTHQSYLPFRAPNESPVTSFFLCFSLLITMVHTPFWLDAVNRKQQRPAQFIVKPQLRGHFVVIICSRNLRYTIIGIPSTITSTSSRIYTSSMMMSHSEPADVGMMQSERVRGSADGERVSES
jgi:hypothetical protein